VTDDKGAQPVFGKHSKPSVEDYVERELDRTIRANYPELKVIRGNEWADTETRRRGKRQFWTVQGHAGKWHGDYNIEARHEDDELLIWFGFSSAGALGTQHIVMPAVHLRLSDLKATEEAFREDDYSLGAVLEWMLDSGERPSDMSFPMNQRFLT
jgi:hypothetical protein